MEKKELVSSSKVKAVPFVLGIRSAESVPVDVFALASLFFGVLVFLLRVRMYAWLSLLTLLASLASQRPSEMEFKQVSASLMLVVMSFFSAYGQPLVHTYSKT
mmetsp:Transcript_2890/g.5075  ORF Transcript_2890/g.5075 Transcript_2890/m.5075 type:complete len:103 (-) Transcript_2890:146-454(-)